MSGAGNQDRQRPAGYSIPLVSVFGIEIRLDASVLIIFALIVFSLGSGLFPEWHPDWSGGLVWGTAVAAGILFFVSLLAHELAHSVVARKFGIPVPRITLFLFGGMAETGREPDRAGEEFLIAIAGPLMSIVIGLACSSLTGWIVSDRAMLQQLAQGDEMALMSLSPVTTTLLWLGSINMILAIFNLIPGFPMDGGRVFRAIIWGLTGDQIKATRWASNMGRLFGWSLMALGVLSLLGGRGLGGIWWILIGWFISNLARMSYSQLLTDRALKGFKVVDLMNTRFDRVAPDLSVQQFIDEYVLRSTQQLWPVFEGDCLCGFVHLSDVIELDPDARDRRTVGDLARAPERLPSLDAGMNARRVLEAVTGADLEPIPVMQDGRLVGLIQRSDVMRWISLHELD